MAETKTDKEPSIEEILESIRQIISEDGDSAAKPAEVAAPIAAAPAPAPAPMPPPAAPAPAPQKVEAVLELTDRVEPLKSDLDLSATEPPAMSPAPEATADTAAILSESAATASAEAMSKLLAGNVAVEQVVPGRVGNVTLEEMARDLMRPLVKSWLDQNLPGIIEKMVQKEIEKISRRAGG